MRSDFGDVFSSHGHEKDRGACDHLWRTWSQLLESLRKIVVTLVALIGRGTRAMCVMRQHMHCAFVTHTTPIATRSHVAIPTGLGRYLCPSVDQSTGNKPEHAALCHQCDLIK